MIGRCIFLTLLGLLVSLSVEAVPDNKNKWNNRTIERQIPLRTHSIYAPYIDQDLQNRWWDFGGDSYVNTAKHIRLTRDRPSQMGWLWSRLPLSASNYVIEMEFKISGDLGHLYGDGLAIWLTQARAQPGPVFGSVDNFHGLGIFIDTFANARHSYTFPRISAMLNDGTKVYDHDNDGEQHEIGACSGDLRNTDVATKLKISYFKDTKTLTVQMHHKAWDEWTDCFVVGDVVLPPSPFLGFSALTGEVSDAHDIIAINSYSAILSPADKPRDKIRTSIFGSKATDGEPRTWLSTLFNLALLAGVVAGGWFGYKEYQKRARSGRPIFGNGNFGGVARRFDDAFSNGKRF